MTDRELLELAAKAAGMVLGEWHGSGYWADMRDSPYGEVARHWNPLTDDGDALRLSVKLRIDVNHSITMVVAERDDSVDDFVVGVAEGKSNDPYAATRRAIVRVAAAIGEKME
jgi:hypothetical protein